MKLLPAVLFAVTLGCGLAQAASPEPASEVLEQVYEVESFVVNYSPNSQSLGRILAARCPGCTAETFTFDKLTQLEVGGKSMPIDEIRLKAEWSGLITVTDQNPEKIIKITIY